MFSLHRECVSAAVQPGCIVDRMQRGSIPRTVSGKSPVEITSRLPVASPFPALARGMLAAGPSAIGCIAVLAVTPWVLGAQDVARAAVDRSYDAYLEVYAEYQETRDAGYELAGRWDLLLDELSQAEERGDEAAKRRLRPAIQELAEDRESAQREFLRVEAEWREAGRTLIGLIGSYQDVLSKRLLAADEASQADLLRQFEEMGNRRSEVEEQMGPRELAIPDAPNIQAYPEDTPLDRASKAASWEEYAVKLQRFLAILEVEIERLEKDQQMEATMRGFGRDQLGNRIVPVGAGGAGGGRGGADTTEVDLAQPTLAQQIETLRGQEDEVANILERVLAQAAALRGRSGGTP